MPSFGQAQDTDGAPAPLPEDLAATIRARTRILPVGEAEAYRLPQEDEPEPEAEAPKAEPLADRTDRPNYLNARKKPGKKTRIHTRQELAPAQRPAADPAPMPKRPASDIGKALDLIRGMIAEQDTAPTPPPAEAEIAANPEPEPQKPAPSPQEDDRWAILRVPLEELEDEEFEEEYESEPEPPAQSWDEPAEDDPSTPIDRIRARLENSLPEAPEGQETLDYAPWDDSVFGASGTLDDPEPEPSEPEPAAPEAGEDVRPAGRVGSVFRKLRLF